MIIENEGPVTSTASLAEIGYPMFDERPIDGVGPYVRAFVSPDAALGLPIEHAELDGT